MQIKKYEAIDMQEALRRIRSELGPDAVILSTRKVKRGGGAFGILGRPVVEVTAAIDYPPPSPDRANSISRRESGGKAGSPLPVELFIREDIQRLKEEIQTLLASHLTRRPSDLSGLQEEIAGLRESLAGLMRVEADPPAVPEGGIPGSPDGGGGAAGIRSPEIYRRYLARGVAEDLARRMTEILDRREGEKGWEGAVPEERAKEMIRRQTRVTGPIWREGEERKAVMFVGPTGGGKTTTLAKVAAQYALTEKRKVVLVTLDTYRIAAVEQLRIYARILGVPVEVAFSPEELGRIWRRYEEAELFLVDTAGRSPADGSYLEELRSYYPSPGEGKKGGGEGSPVRLEGQLVLPASLRLDVLEETVRRYAAFPIRGLLFTKLDEVDTRGQMFNLMIRAQKPLSYATMGQRVPEDIERVTPERMAQWVMG